MTTLYERAFVTIKVPLTISPQQIRLQNEHFWTVLLQLTEMVVSWIPRRWFIRFGNATGEAQLQLAKQCQSYKEYNRIRLAHPARSYWDERQLLQQFPGAGQTDGAFLELVMGFSENIHLLQGKCQDFREQSQGDGTKLEVSLVARPEDLACHTPLNQRLLTANFDLCQWFTILLLRLKPKHRDQVNKQAVLGISLAAFRRICHALELEEQEQVQILAFGRRYLSQYLEISEADLHADPAVSRRVQALPQLEARAEQAADGMCQNLSLTIPGRQWLQEHCQTTWFFFPESFWMQYHWFNNFVGLDLAAELALVDALVVAAARASTCEVFSDE